MGRPIFRRTCFSAFTLLSTFAILQEGCVQTVPPEPPAEDPFADRPGSGTASVKGFVQSAEGETPLPLGGVRLALGDAVAFSNVDGSFFLESVRAGKQPFFVDGTTAQSGDGAYGQFATTLALVEEQQLALERPIHLPFVPLTSLRKVAPDRLTTVMSAEGIELEIPPGGAQLDGKPYEGEIAIVTVAADRTPLALPKRLDGLSRLVISVQPIGVTFPVPVKLTIPAAIAGELDIAYGTIWSLESATGDFVGHTATRRKGDVFVPVAGGIRTGGFHLLTEMQIEVREPCFNAEDESDARACFDASTRAMEAVMSLPAPTLPGARTLFGRLDASMLAATASRAPVADIVAVTSEMIPVARQSLRSYQSVYRSVSDLELLSLRLTQVRAACGISEPCDPKDGEALLAQAETEMNGAISAIQDNTAKFASRFDRLAAAVAALEPFYVVDALQGDPALAGFRIAAAEYDAAYRDFAPFASPIDAYDALIHSLNAMEQAARSIHEAVSVRSRDEDAAIVQRICSDRGATMTATSSEGFAILGLGEESGRLLEECTLSAINPVRGLAVRPIRETRMLEGFRPPYFASLTGTVTERSLPEADARSGMLTSDSPVHRWTVNVESRRGVRAAFFADRPAMTGLSFGHNVLLAREGGFDVFNLSDAESYSFLVFGLEMQEQSETTYVLSSTTLDSLHDFGESVGGSFDVNTRAAAMLFNGRAGDRVVVERTCCDPSGSQFAFSLREPDGRPALRVDFERETPGTGDEAFELTQDGLHRVVLAPFAGEFADYELTLHRALSSDVAPINLGEEVTATFDEIGATAVYTFVGGAGQIATIEGVSSSETAQVVYSLVAPDGVPVGKGKVLYFDGSTFASRAEQLPIEGSYRLIFSSRLSDGAPIGAFTFRVSVRNPT